MNVFKRLFGIKTKNLYLAKLAKTDDVLFYGYGMYTTIHSRLIPHKYVLVRKKDDEYKDQKDGTKYGLSAESIEQGEIGVSDLEPIKRKSNRISYKEAMNLLEEKNILNKEISTKNLYLAQLATFESTQGNERKFKKSNPPKYVLVKKTLAASAKSYCDQTYPDEYLHDYPHDNLYQDIFTNTEYKLYSNVYAGEGETVVHSLEPIVTDSQKITYYDADKILKSKNSVYIKK